MGYSPRFVLSLWGIPGFFFSLFIVFSFGKVEANKLKLLDAKKVPLSALTGPGRFYFLEFPVDEVGSDLNPICADGSPYSFAFRRGTDEHVSKFLIEFEGGPACWDDGSVSACCESSMPKKRVPWGDYMTYFRDQVVSYKTFPELGTCKGVPSGFVSQGAEFLLSGNLAIDELTDGDLPIPLRDFEKGDWWEQLGGKNSDIRDWSYILLPHCSMDWHLGHQKVPQMITSCGGDTTSLDAIYQRGGTNVDAVMKWIRKQFPSGPDALVTISGGKLGGCAENSGASSASSIAPALLAEKFAKRSRKLSPNSTLVVTEGSGLWDRDSPTTEEMEKRWNSRDLSSGSTLPQVMESIIESSTDKTQFVWMASSQGFASEEETLWFIKQSNNFGQKFHLFEPKKSEYEWCPAYSFPYSEPGVAQFFADVVETMSWSAETILSSRDRQRVSALSLGSGTQPEEDYESTRSRLSFLSIFIIISSLVGISWILYFIIKRNNSRSGKKAPLSPSDLWFIALTKYPITFFVVSLIVPITLSIVAFSQNDVSINMDFDSYLQVDTDLENVKRNFNKAQENQKASLEIEEANCMLFGNSIFSARKLSSDKEMIGTVNNKQTSEDSLRFGNQEILDELDLDIEVDHKVPLHAISAYHRQLMSENLNYFSGGEWVSIMYQNRKGGNVFEPDVLRAIHAFENSIYDFPEFQDYCYGFGRQCLPIDSLVSRFFANGQLVGNTNAILTSFLKDRPALWKLDQYFGPNNLGSNVTRSFVFLRNMGGDQSRAHPFLRSLYRNFLVKHDREKTYPEFIHTWNNYIMKTTEADDALLHDTLWSIGSLFFIALMILLKVQSVFVVFFAMLGLVLAFSVSYYWVSAHFLINDITLIWVAGLFVMLGIGADDIFLMVDSFDHTKHDFEESTEETGTSISSGDDHSSWEDRLSKKHEILRKRMKVAYSKAGSMMLVSSVTTAICFFSNGFGVLTVIQEFGIFMGMVVLINYLHVMTILPSSILLNELYVADLQEAFVTWCKSLCCRKKPEDLDESLKSSEIEDDDAEKRLDGPVGGKSKRFTVHSLELSRTDRYLTHQYAPFIKRRSYYLVGSTVALAIILGISAVFTFKVNDGSIVLFSSRYNLGRLETVIDRYYNDDEDVYTTIEAENQVPTFAPTQPPIGMAGTTFKPTYDPNKLINATITFVSPEEAAAMNLPGALTPEQYAEMVKNAVGGGAPNSGIQGSGNGSSNSNQGGGGYVAGQTYGSGSGNNGSGGENKGTGGGVSIQVNGPNKNPIGGVASVDAQEMRRRETIHVKLIWGVESEKKDSSIWVTKKVTSSNDNSEDSSSPPRTHFDLSEPQTQQWLLDTVEMAKNNPKLFVRQDKNTWIERLRDFARFAGVEFPLPKHLFTTYVELLKTKDAEFAEAIETGIGTTAPGLAGDFTFASITMMVDSVEVGNAAKAAGRSMSEDIYKEWTAFTVTSNEALQENSDLSGPPVVAQSSIFLDAYRVDAMFESTLMTWFVANGVCLLVILLFLQNLALSFMVMVTITLILLCLGGLLFAVYHIPFGPVEALGVSIFIGLSANYSLHVVHAYHHSRSLNRDDKIKEAIFAVGSPIVASALSTMGASAFLFGCRTWVFIELGILICSITGMALLFTMTFLFSWLSLAGPLPVYDPTYNSAHVDGKIEHPSHRWDLKVLCYDPCCKKDRSQSFPPSDLDFMEQDSKRQVQEDSDNDSVYSIDVLDDDEGGSPLHVGIGQARRANNIDDDDDGSEYSIEVLDDAEDDIDYSATEKGDTNPAPDSITRPEGNDRNNEDKDCPLIYHLNDTLNIVERTA